MKDYVLYSTGCPRCKVLTAKLDAKGVDYELVSDEDEIINDGVTTIPTLKVAGEMLPFADAVKHVNSL